MADELNFSLPSRKTPPGGVPKVTLILLGIVLAAVIADIFVSVGRGTPKNDAADGGGLSPDVQKQLALKLEKQGLTGQAVDAWKEYMATARGDAEDMANIWYRLGKLYQEDGAYDRALDAYYRSESFAEIEALAPEISRRTAECLEALGKFAALRYALAERVSMDEDAGEEGAEIVAEIGSHKITKAQLDGEIERQIELQMERFASYLPQEQQKQQKEALLKQLSTAQERLRFLNQMVAEEVLYRKAREENLADDAETRALIRDAERAILTQRLVEKEMSEQIKITPADVETYYQAHQADYLAPERARIAHILLPDASTADEALRRLKAGEAFADVAAEMSMDDATKSAAGELDVWIEKGQPIAQLGYSEHADALIFNTDAGQLSDGYLETDLGFHVFKVLEREASRQRGFDEVQNEVYQALRTRKEREVQQQLLEELKETYDVVIHRKPFAQAAPSDDAGADPTQPNP